MNRKPAWLLILVPFLMGWEGIDLVARHQAIDPPSVITYCIGRTNADGGHVRPGQHFSREQCKEYLIHDSPKYNAALMACYPMDTLPPNRHAALVSFGYNVGPGTFCKSSVVRYLKQGRIRDACNALLRYDRANGRYLKGLHNRRVAERALCLRED